jgi:hypothetical protein
MSKTLFNINTPYIPTLKNGKYTAELIDVRRYDGYYGLELRPTFDIYYKNLVISYNSGRIFYNSYTWHDFLAAFYKTNNGDVLYDTGLHQMFILTLNNRISNNNRHYLSLDGVQWLEED